jgi:hypothetical protein
MKCVLAISGLSVKVLLVLQARSFFLAFSVTNYTTEIGNSMNFWKVQLGETIVSSFNSVIFFAVFWRMASIQHARQVNSYLMIKNY